MVPLNFLFQLRELALNMISRILATREEELPDRSLYAKMKNLQDDVEKYLTEDIVEEKIEEFRSGVKSQGQDMAIRHRNPAVQAELDMREELAQKGGIEVVGGVQSGVGESILDPLGRMKKPRAVDEQQTDPELDELGMGFSAAPGSSSSSGVNLNNREIRKIGGPGGLSAATKAWSLGAVSSNKETNNKESEKMKNGDDGKVGDEETDSDNSSSNNNKGDDKDSKDGPTKPSGKAGKGEGPDKGKGYLLNWG
jgi:hypothetical protein